MFIKGSNLIMEAILILSFRTFMTHVNKLCLSTQYVFLFLQYFLYLTVITLWPVFTHLNKIQALIFQAKALEDKSCSYWIYGWPVVTLSAVWVCTSECGAGSFLYYSTFKDDFFLIWAVNQVLEQFPIFQHFSFKLKLCHLFLT